MSYAINLDLGQLSNNSAIRFRRCVYPSIHRVCTTQTMLGNQFANQERRKKMAINPPILRQTANQEVNLPFINKIEKRITLLFRLLFSLSSLFTEHEKLTYLLSIS